MISPTQVKKTTCGIHYQASETFFISSKREGTTTIHQRFTQIWAISRSGPARCEVGARWKGGMPRTQGAPLSALIPTSIDVFVSKVHDKFHTSDANIYIYIYIYHYIITYRYIYKYHYKITKYIYLDEFILQPWHWMAMICSTDLPRKASIIPPTWGRHGGFGMIWRFPKS